MIETSLNVTRTLHNEHMAVLSLLDRFGAFLRKQADRPPATGDAATMNILSELATALAGEISAHFAFEEESLFPRLAEAGEGEFAEMLTEEHGEIRPVAERIIALADGGRMSGFSPTDWAEFRRLGALLIDLLGDHAQKEEMALLRALDDILDEAEDERLSAQYADRR